VIPDVDDLHGVEVWSEVLPLFREPGNNKQFEPIVVDPLDQIMFDLT